MGLTEKIKLYVFQRVLNTLIASKTAQKAFGTMRFQKPFENLHKLALKGMNIGEGADVSNSGEETVLKYIHAKQKANKLVVFDVGANVGNYSLILRNLLGPDTVIHAFEPAKETYHVLSQKLEGSNVITHNFGLGAEDKMFVLYYDKELSAGASVFNRRLDHFGGDMAKSEEITISKLSTFCSQNQISKIDLLKMDIEGYEFETLSSVKNMLANGSISYIQFEFGGANLDSRSSFQDFWYLLSPNYNIYRIVRDGLFKIDTYKEDYEIYLTTNFLAEYKN